MKKSEIRNPKSERSSKPEIRNASAHSADFQSNAIRISETVRRVCRGGTCDNSPTFQRWGSAPGEGPVPKGRLSEHTRFRPSLRDLGMVNPSPNVETLGYYQTSLRDERNHSRFPDS